MYLINKICSLQCACRLIGTWFKKLELDNYDQTPHLENTSFWCFTSYSIVIFLDY